ncbi:hypothetical protein T459_14903 [Capsicum annuum]|uniref:Uncharacterized protein n=1 Tax=Capsicum annuum TaxID=4072 RepID=A0A2G2ZIQ7_CAPAN|nr:hypothetical protein T459_14903 [Capsicum annuum]
MLQRLYEDMTNKIDVACKAGTNSYQTKLEYKGFSKWELYSSKKTHAAILQVYKSNKDEGTKDIDWVKLRTLVYFAREKRPQHFYNFKARAMNALVSGSAKINNGPVLLNNNSKSIQDALCFIMDEEKSHEIIFVQFPQSFENATKNEVYGSLRVIDEVEFHGADGYGGPLYSGTSCFQRRDTLYGRDFSIEARIDLKRVSRF